MPGAAIQTGVSSLSSFLPLTSDTWPAANYDIQAQLLDDERLRKQEKMLKTSCIFFLVRLKEKQHTARTVLFFCRALVL